jgi:hypothetical protein
MLYNMLLKSKVSTLISYITLAELLQRLDYMISAQAVIDHRKGNRESLAR